MLSIWICRSEIKKLNNHQKSGDLYRNVEGGFSRVSFLGVGVYDHMERVSSWVEWFFTSTHFQK
jgi:hypothetical protein